MILSGGMKATFDHNNFKIYMGCTDKSYEVHYGLVLLFSLLYASSGFPDSLQSLQKAFRAAGITYKTLDQLPELVKGIHGKLKYGYLENGMKWISWETIISPSWIFCFSTKMLSMGWKFKAH
ncbi:uncharacterized protein LOC113288738 [Papaver somniferum]|uniref:uncharacterized protein LOC113288738 n=1 Tax=Papaver somniferum TaxID=3469 RepID=UPI000E70172B|nr:uncharacterized protein LOC113288738 [Papaver somniferum]